MSDDLPGRPEPADDLIQAYTQAQALVDGGRGPSGAVRGKVLAAAGAMAADAAARAAVEGAGDTAAIPPLAPVAPPVGAVGRGRLRAINLSPWRLRSGAAWGALLLAGLAGWRFEASRRIDAGERVAVAELRTAAPASQLPRERPAPVSSGAPSPDATPPRLDGRPQPAQHPAAAAAKPIARDPGLIVAQVDRQPDRRALRAAPGAAPAEARAPQPHATPAPTAADAASPARAVAEAPDAAPPAVATVTAAAAAPGRPRFEIEASRVAFSGAAARAAPKKSAPGSAGAPATASARLLPDPLHAAADRGDVETLKKLLADPSTPVDAPDPAGRTALLRAVLAQQAAAVRLLLAAGADPSHPDLAGLTPREAARTGADGEIATLLAAPR